MPLWPQPFYYMKLKDKEPKVLFCDNHLLAVSKPCGMPTQPNSTQQLSLEEWAKAYIKEKFEKSGAVFLHAVHRLDKPTSGIVLFARTSKALSRLNEMQRARKIKKYYMAKVEGHLIENKGILRHFLKHDSFKSKALTYAGEGAKEALLQYEVMEELEDSSLLRIELLTGRYHQIRSQLAAEGHPLVGDVKYGAKPEGSFSLTHYRVELEHPVTHEQLIISLSKI